MNNSLPINETSLVSSITSNVIHYKYTLFGVGLITLTTISYKNGYWNKIKNWFY